MPYLKQRLQGIFTPNIVPLDQRGEINEPELRRYVDWLIERGVHGLYPNGSTGEFTRFTAEERRRIIEIIADQTAGRVPILAGAAEANARETIRACEHYHALGCTRRGDRVAVLLQTQPGRRLCLLQRNRRPLAHRRDALQHPHVRLADRRADGAAAGGRMPTRRRRSRTRRATCPT